MELYTYVVSTPSGVVVLQAESYEVDCSVSPPHLLLRIGGRVIGEFLHFAGIWEQAQQDG